MSTMNSGKPEPNCWQLSPTEQYKETGKHVQLTWYCRRVEVDDISLEMSSIR